MILLFCRIHRHALWILGEHCSSANDITTVMREIKEGLGEVSDPNKRLFRLIDFKQNYVVFYCLCLLSLSVCSSGI